MQPLTPELNRLRSQLRDVARRFAEAYWPKDVRGGHHHLEIGLSDDECGFLSVVIDDLNVPPGPPAQPPASLSHFIEENFTAAERREYPDVYVMLGVPVEEKDKGAPCFNNVYRRVDPATLTVI